MTRRMIRLLAALAVLLAGGTAALAQTPLQVVPCVPAPSANGFTTVCIDATAANPFPVTAATTTPAAGSGNAGYPTGATPVAASTVNTTTGATNTTTATLSSTAGQFTYICGWNAFTNGGTAQDVSIGVGQVEGLFPQYLFSVPAFAATNATKIGDIYTPCLKAGNVNAGVSVSVPAQGTGNTNVTINAWGYTQ